MPRAVYTQHQPSRSGVTVFDFVEGQNAFARFLEQLYDGVPFMDGALLEGVSLVTGENLVSHGLGREARGFYKLRDSVGAPDFNAYLGSTQTIATGTDTLVEIDTERFDHGSSFDVASYMFTAPHAGLYHFNACIAYSSNQTSDHLMWMRLGGTTYRFGRSSNGRYHSGAAVAELAAGDTAGIYTSQQSGGNQDLIASRSWLSGHALTDLTDQQIGHTDGAQTLKLHSQCDRTADLWVF